jgi:hypothetical protein
MKKVASGLTLVYGQLTMVIRTEPCDLLDGF